MRELGRGIVFLEQPEVLRPELRQGLETWLHGREGVEAGRTIEDARAELNTETVDPAKTQQVEEIKRWLMGFPA